MLAYTEPSPIASVVRGKESPISKVQNERSHFRVCNLCEAMCGIEIRLHDDRIVSIRGDEKDALSRGHICPKAVALQDLHNDPDRLKRPLRRQGVEWQEVGWDEALDEVARRIRETQKTHGRDSMAVYAGNPTVHSSGALLFGPPLLRALHTKNRFTATSVDQLPHHLAASQMFGHQLLLPVPDIDRTRCLLILGANPVASNGSMMTAPGMLRRLKELKKRGGRLLVVDPRRTETARLADRHHFIRPGSDALLLLSILHTLFAESLVQLGKLESFVDSVAEVEGLAADFPPESIAERTGISSEQIRSLARDLADGPSACYGRMGVSTHEFGGLCLWLCNVINIVTGNLDRPGGVMFTKPAVDILSSTGRGSFGRKQSRVRGLPSFGGELPASALAEEIDTEGDGRIRALLTLGGNPVLSTPNGGRLERALPQLDFMVSIDPYLNETTRFADFILPPTMPLERDHYDLVFHALAVRNTARYSPALFDPEPGTRHDWQILAGLHRRLGAGSFKADLQRRAAAALGPRRLIDLGLRSGPYGSGWRPFGSGLTLAKVEKANHGIDLGPLEPCLPERLKTRNGRIDLAPAVFLSDLDRLRNYRDRETAEEPTLRLVGRRQVRSNNSWMHNAPRLMRGKDRCSLLVHSEDAKRLELQVDARVVVTSRTGRVDVPIEISDEMMPGVVSLPHGWGHDREGVRLQIAGAQPGASLNDLTDDQQIDSLSGNASFSGIEVRVESAKSS